MEAASASADDGRKSSGSPATTADSIMKPEAAKSPAKNTFMEKMVALYKRLTTRSRQRKLLCDLPTDWLIQVLDFLPTRQLFVLMRTNKEWNRVCKYIIKYRKTLIIDRYCQIRTLMRGGPNPNLFVIEWRETDDVEKMIKSLMQMINLEHLIVFKWGPYHCPQLYPLIAQNACTLRELDVFHSPENQTLVFPKLKKLHCTRLDVSNAASMYPKLERLWTENGVIGLHPQKSLISSLTHLKYGRDDWEEFEGHGFNYEDPSFTTFVLMHASSLILLRCDNLTAEDQISFPKLTDLTIWKVPENNITFPAVEYVKVTTCKPSISRLPLEKIVQFKSVMSGQNTLSDEIEVCKSIAKMVSLKYTELKLELRFAYGNAAAAEYPDLFSNIHQLESVSLRAASHQKCLIQKWLPTLTQSNPELKTFELYGIPLTDEDLTLLSKLTKVETIHAFGRGFTIAGMREFLRGSSRNVIQTLMFAAGGSKMDEKLIKQVDKEITAIEVETGVTFERTRIERRYPVPVMRFSQQ